MFFCYFLEKKKLKNAGNVEKNLHKMFLQQFKISSQEMKTTPNSKQEAKGIGERTALKSYYRIKVMSFLNDVTGLNKHY